ncbi:hypothetical protein [Pararhodobacter sp.]|uniref:hypothetical protein n=1 Tax=Pararhodobacter sp. TaxID=2127056 RepID=UPI002FDF5036
MKKSLIGAVAALAIGAGMASAQTIGIAGVPTGFGAAGGVAQIGFSATYSQRARGAGPTRTHGDAATVANFGFGNPVTGLGIEFGINLTSFRRFGQSGHLSFGLHRLWQAGPGVFSAALRAAYVSPWGDINAYRPAYSLTGTYLGGIGPRMAMVSVGVGTGWGQRGNDRTVRGAVGVGLGLNEQWAASLGYVGQESVVGAVWNPPALGGTSVAFSVRNLEESGNATFAVDIGRAFALMR